jgi:hypothetical protein
MKAQLRRCKLEDNIKIEEMEIKWTNNNSRPAKPLPEKFNLLYFLRTFVCNSSSSSSSVEDSISPYLTKRTRLQWAQVQSTVRCLHTFEIPAAVLRLWPATMWFYEVLSHIVASAQFVGIMNPGISMFHMTPPFLSEGGLWGDRQCGKGAFFEQK